KDTRSKPAQRQAWQALVLYWVVGALWVLVGDGLLARWAPDADHLQRYQTWKGWLYVLLTAVLAWGLLCRAHRAEHKRALAEASTARTLRHVPAGIARIALDGTILWANVRWLEMLGTTPEQVRTLNFGSVVPAIDQSDGLHQLGRLLA